MLTGEVLKPLDETSGVPKRSERRGGGVERRLYDLLPFLSNPRIESGCGTAARQFPEAYVSLSHEILLEFKSIRTDFDNGSQFLCRSDRPTSRYLVLLGEEARRIPVFGGPSALCSPTAA